jgi:hypothetical protein
MAFTFARCVDAALAEPELQTTIIGALLTLGLVEPERDESRGALRQAVADLAWLTWNGRDADMLFIRRARSAPGGGDAWLWIGVEHGSAAYRIACAPTGPAMRPRIVREVAAVGVADRCFWPSRTGGFHARIISASRWAAAPATEGGFSVPGRTMSRALPLAPPAVPGSGWAIGA